MAGTSVCLAVLLAVGSRFSLSYQVMNCSSNEQTALHDLNYLPSTSTESHLVTRMELNDLIRDLDLPKNKAEVLGSRLTQWNLLASDVRTSLYHDCQKYLPFFDQEGGIAVYNNICGLMSAINVDYNPDERRLFVDASKTSLKTVLLQNGNQLPSIPVAYAVPMKETIKT